MSDPQPAISIEGFTVEFPRSFRYRRRAPKEGALLDAVERLRHRYEETIGAYRLFSPRLESRVEHRVVGSVDDIVAGVGLRFRYDPLAHEYRAASKLGVPWSWPRLPVWISVQSASSRHTIIAVSLRSRRRVRYPRRYYAAAHAWLRAIRSG